MSYWEHWKANMKVVAKCFVLAFFHFIHAWFPYDITSHDYWGVYLKKAE